jgi:hypothetical protein
MKSYSLALRFLIIIAVSSHYLIFGQHLIVSIVMDYFPFAMRPLFSIVPFIGLILLWPTFYTVGFLLLTNALLGLFFLIPAIIHFNDRHGAGLLMIGFSFLFLANALLLLFILFKLMKRLKSAAA